MSLSYRQIEESPGQYKRFAAFGGDNGDSPISVDAWIDLLSSPAEIVKFVDVIKEASFDYPAFFFETKGVSPKTLSKQFEIVLVKSKDLERFVQQRGHDFDVFAEYLNTENGVSGDDCSSVSFFNLDRTSKLLAPKAVQPSKYIYSHLGVFLRNASDKEIIGFWQLVGKEYRKSLDESEKIGGNKTLWLSTSGTGVAWLHMRIDDRPKYYTFRSFAEEK